VAIVRPFLALRPAFGLAPRVASPPYDVVSTEEARAIAKESDESFLRVSRPEVGLPEGTDEHSEEAYAQGKRALDDFVAKSVLAESAKPGLWLYEQTMGSHKQIGLVACASVDEYDLDYIKKHEKTRPDKEEDRTKHIDALSAHDEPVFLSYRAQPSIDAIVTRASAGTAEEDFTTSDGVHHRVWSLSEEEERALIAAFGKDVPALYVADGHHRSAAASRVHAKRGGGNGEHGVFLAVIFPHDQLQILAYNRVVKDAKHRSPEELRKAIRAKFDLMATSEPAPDEPRTFGLYFGGRWYLATPRSDLAIAKDPVGALDCSVCQTHLLDAIFGITDPRTDDRVEFVGGIRGAAELERRVQEDGFDLAIHLYPTQMDELLTVSDAGLLMPPKSTWFEPKLRSGLFVHRF
jgi:uncharacterized protein (DUF1015 family)